MALHKRYNTVERKLTTQKIKKMYSNLKVIGKCIGKSFSNIFGKLYLVRLKINYKILKLFSM